MKPNPDEERLSIPEIITGLTELEKFLGVDADSRTSPLYPFKSACQIYQMTAAGPFGIELAYETESFRECVMFGPAPAT